MLDSKNKVIVKPGHFSKSILIPTSKSYANRILILASLSPSVVTIEGLPESTDVSNLINCLEKVGIKFLKGPMGTVKVLNSFPECENNNDSDTIYLETGDGGTTNRFILPFLARGRKQYVLKPQGKMRIRPMEELINSLTLLGADITEKESSGGFDIEVKGPLDFNERKLSIDCERSTQFASALAMSLWDFEEFEFELLNLKSSKSYYEMTLGLIKELRLGKSSFCVPVDFSSLSYPLALGAVTGEVFIENCSSLDIFQADACFISILKKMGADLYWEEGGGLKLRVAESLKPLNYDCSDCPDLVPTLAFLCSYVDGVSCLTNIKVLRHKESDRVFEIERLFKAFGIDYSYNNELDRLEIRGEKLSKEHLRKFLRHDPPEDHRMVMVSYLFMKMNNGGEVTNASHVRKSFPNFFNAMG